VSPPTGGSPPTPIHVLTGAGATLRWRDTPWDARALGVASAEIVAIDGDPAGAPPLLAELDRVAAAAGIGVIVVRLPAEARELKRHVQVAGYQFVETSHPLRLAPIPADLGPIGRRRVAIEDAAGADRDPIAELARASFDHSRFHEDARVHPARARARHAGWIGDSFDRGDGCLIHRRAGGVAAIMTFRLDGAAATLFLGGTRPGLELIAPMFWAAVVAELAARGATRIDTRVSAANLGALRLHLALGFVARGTDHGFTRIYDGALASVGSPPAPPSPPS